MAQMKKKQIAKADNSNLNAMMNAYDSLSDEEWNALTTVLKGLTDGEMDAHDFANAIMTALQHVGDEGYTASTKKSKLSKEYRVNTDRDIDIDIMAGELTVRVSDVQSGWAKNKQIDVMNLPWQIVGDITEILGENWNEIPQFVAIENSLVEQYDEHWQEVDRQLHEQNGWKSTKKSKSVKKEYDENVFDEKLKQALIDRGINVTSIERFMGDGDYIVTVADWDESTKGALEQCFKRVLPFAYEHGTTPSEYEYRCLDEMISQSDWWVDKSTKKSMKEQSFSEMVDARRRLNRKGRQ